MLLQPDMFCVNATGAQLINGEADKFLDRVRDCTDRDEKVVKALKELGISGNLRGEEWAEENGLILYCNRVYSDSKNCPNVLHFLLHGHIASQQGQTEPICWCM